MAKMNVEAWGSAQLREKLRNKVPDDVMVLREAGLLDKDVIDFLIEFQEFYKQPSKDYPARAENTKRYKKIVKKNASKNLQQAIRNGDTNTIHHFLGVQNLDVTMEGGREYEKISRWVARETAINYIAGHMGYGKTDFAILCGEWWTYRMSQSDVTLQLASNIQSLTVPYPIRNKYNLEIKYIDNQPDLAEWIEKDHDKKVFKRFIFDEASSHASGYSRDAKNVVKQLSSMVKLMRKNGGNMDIIGHTGKDVHPDIRRLADYVEKEGKKDAAVFENVDNAEGEDKKFDLKKIPQTTWGYDTKEESKWEWGTAEGQKGTSMLEIACKVYINSKMTQGEVAEMFDVDGVSKSNISQNYKKYT